MKRHERSGASCQSPRLRRCYGDEAFLGLTILKSHHPGVPWPSFQSDGPPPSWAPPPVAKEVRSHNMAAWTWLRWGRILGVAESASILPGRGVSLALSLSGIAKRDRRPRWSQELAGFELESSQLGWVQSSHLDGAESREPVPARPEDRERLLRGHLPRWTGAALGEFRESMG